MVRGLLTTDLPVRYECASENADEKAMNTVIASAVLDRQRRPRVEILFPSHHPYITVQRLEQMKNACEGVNAYESTHGLPAGNKQLRILLTCLL